MARWSAGRCDHRLPATASAAVCSSIREQGGASREAGRSMNCTSGLAVVSHRGEGAAPDACELDMPAFDRPRSISGVAAGVSDSGILRRAWPGDVKEYGRSGGTRDVVDPVLCVPVVAEGCAESVGADGDSVAAIADRDRAVAAGARGTV